MVPNLYERGLSKPPPAVLKCLAQLLDLDHLELVALAAGAGNEGDRYFAIDPERAPHIAYLCAFSPRVLEQLRDVADRLARGETERMATKEPGAAR